jgi:hypothetical protein
VARKAIRKQRSFAIHMDPRNYFEFEALVMDFNTQKIMGLKNGEHQSLIGETRLEFKRDRDNKEPKILHTSTSATSDAWFNTNHQLFSYDHLIAVDTNTNSVNGSTVSITAAYHMKPQGHDQNYANCLARVLALVEYWNVVEKPENLGWWQILKALADHPMEYAGKIGLIVDSDLGNHQAFNDRTIPIFSDFFLPENVTIIYGSDKGGGEHLSTKMIKYCHDLASDLYKKQNLVINTENLNPGLEGFYTHIRQWDEESGDLRPFCN